MPVVDHRHRRGGHHERHHPIGHHARGHGQRVARHRQELQHRAAAVGGGFGRGLARRAQHQQDRQGDQRQQRLAEEAADVGRARYRVAREDHQLRPDDGTRETPHHYPGNRLGLERVLGGVGGCEAVALHIRAVEARQEGAGAEDPERGQHDAQRGDQARGHAEADPDHVSVAAAMAPHDERRRQGADGKTQAEQTHGQGDPGRILGKLLADQPTQRHHDGRAGAAERLRGGENADVSARDALVGHGRSFLFVCLAGNITRMNICSVIRP